MINTKKLINDLINSDKELSQKLYNDIKNIASNYKIIQHQDDLNIIYNSKEDYQKDFFDRLSIPIGRNKKIPLKLSKYCEDSNTYAIGYYDFFDKEDYGKNITYSYIIIYTDMQQLFNYCDISRSDFQNLYIGFKYVEDDYYSLNIWNNIDPEFHILLDQKKELNSCLKQIFNLLQ